MIYDLLDLLDLLEEFFLKIINSGYHFEIKKDKDGKYIESCKTDGNTESCGYEISEKTGKFKNKKRFGKSLSNRAPALLIEIINRKLEYIGKNIIKIDTFKVKASQLNHSTNEYEKKSLSKRWVEILNEDKISNKKFNDISYLMNALLDETAITGISALENRELLIERYLEKAKTLSSTEEDYEAIRLIKEYVEDSEEIDKKFIKICDNILNSNKK